MKIITDIISVTCHACGQRYDVTSSKNATGAKYDETNTPTEIAREIIKNGPHTWCDKCQDLIEPKFAPKLTELVTWISVKDEMPPKDQMVILFRVCGGRPIAQEGFWCEAWRKKTFRLNEYDSVMDCYVRVDGITHWTPCLVGPLV